MYNAIHLPKARPSQLNVSGKYARLGKLRTFEWTFFRMTQLLVKCSKMWLTIATFTVSSLFVFILRSSSSKIFVRSQLNPDLLFRSVRSFNAVFKSSKTSYLGPSYWLSLMVTSSKNSTREGASFVISWWMDPAQHQNKNYNLHIM